MRPSRRSNAESMSWAWDSGVGEAGVDGDAEGEERSCPEEEEEGGGRWELVSSWGGMVL